MKYNYNFCSNCGANFKKESETLYVCPKCDFRIFINPKPGVGALLFNSLGQLLLVRRSYDPGKGKLSLIGGFMEPDETNEVALQREIKEEIGLDINKFSYFGAYAGDYLYKDVGYKLISTFYKSTLPDDFKISLSDEATEFIFIDVDKIKIEDVGLEDNKKAIADLICELSSNEPSSV